MLTVQENISDRLGWHHTMMAVAVWPLTLHLLSDVWSQQPALVRDLEDRWLYRYRYPSIN